MGEPNDAGRSAPLALTRTSILAASPWVLCLLAFSGLRVTLSFLVTCTVLTFAGLALLKVLVPTLRLDTWVLLSLPAGLLEASLLCALAVRFGIDLLFPALLILLTCLMGVWFVFWRHTEVVDLARSVFPAASLAIILSVLICTIYFLPSVLWDGTLRRDGSFFWLYTDCPWYMAMTTSILRGGAPPDMPGLAGAPLWYHYGRFAVAAMVHRFSACTVADSVFRIVGGVGRISLAMSALAFGRVLGAPQGRRWHAGVLGVFGLFFVGELSWPLRTLAEVGRLPWVPGLPQENWEPSAHIIHGASLLWGSIGLFVLLTVLLELIWVDDRARVSYALPFLPALIVPMQGLAALGAAAVSWIELGIRTPRRLSYLVSIGLGIAVTSFVFWVVENPLVLAAHALPLDPDPRPALYEMAIYFFLGLGFLLLGLDWLRSFPRTVASRALMVLLVGFVLLTVVFRDRDFNDYYGIRFATTLLSVLAMARVGTWVGDDPLLVARQVLRRLGSAIAAAAGVFMLVSLVVIVPVGPGSARVAMLLAALGAAALGGLVLGWSSRKGRVVVVAVSGIVGVGFVVQATAWAPVFVGQAIRKVEAHSLSAGEVKGLLRLKELSGPNSLCVTNRHKIPGMVFEPARSYMYAALSERAFVLEGWQYREMDAPGFQDALRFSEEVFASRNPATLCSSLRERGIDFIVARPGTDLAVSEEQCHCIQRIPGCGSLTIYRVTEPVKEGEKEGGAAPSQAVWLR
jgi:hypothetical protein